MVVVVLAVIGVSLWRGSKLGAADAQKIQDRADDPVQANAAVYKDQLRDLEKEYVLGNLNSEELQIARDELARRCLKMSVAIQQAPSILWQSLEKRRL